MDLIQKIRGLRSLWEVLESKGQQSHCWNSMDGKNRCWGFQPSAAPVGDTRRRMLEILACLSRCPPSADVHALAHSGSGSVLNWNCTGKGIREMAFSNFQFCHKGKHLGWSLWGSEIPVPRLERLGPTLFSPLASSFSSFSYLYQINDLTETSSTLIPVFSSLSAPSTFLITFDSLATLSSNQCLSIGCKNPSSLRQSNCLVLRFKLAEFIGKKISYPMHINVMELAGTKWTTAFIPHSYWLNLNNGPIKSDDYSFPPHSTHTLSNGLVSYSTQKRNNMNFEIPMSSPPCSYKTSILVSVCFQTLPQSFPHGGGNLLLLNAEFPSYALDF